MIVSATSDAKELGNVTDSELHSDWPVGLLMPQGMAVTIDTHNSARQDSAVALPAPSNSELHDGSRWDGDAVVDADGTAILIESYDVGTDHPHTYLVIDRDDCACPEDVIAVLNRAGLNPDRERAERLESAIRAAIELLDGEVAHPNRAAWTLHEALK
jgi:hypothetical protein